MRWHGAHVPGEWGEQPEPHGEVVEIVVYPTVTDALAVATRWKPESAGRAPSLACYA